MKTKISVVILTKNEELYIERCLSSIAGLFDDVVVLDSFSTDHTREIATRLGARVFQQAWLGWIEQRAMAIALAKHDWVFVLEADEIVTPALAESVRSTLSLPLCDDNGYSVDRRDDFSGVLLPRMRRRSKRLTFIRMFNRTRSAYDPALIVHDEVRVPGKAIPLQGALIHWRGFTIDEQVRRYADYAPLEADVMQSHNVRVRASHLVLRPLLRFCWCYVLCGGFRLGTRGLAHALMVATSEYLRFATLWERQHGGAATNPPPELVPRSDVQSGVSVAASLAAPVLAPQRNDKNIPLTGTAA